MCRYIVETFYRNGKPRAELTYSARGTDAGLRGMLLQVVKDCNRREANGQPSLTGAFRVSSVEEEAHTWGGGAAVVETRRYVASGIATSHLPERFAVSRDREAGFEAFLNTLARARA